LIPFLLGETGMWWSLSGVPLLTLHTQAFLSRASLRSTPCWCLCPFRWQAERKEDMLIPNTTTFAELMRILDSRKEAAEAAKTETEIQLEEEFEAKLKEIMGDQYEPILEVDQEVDQQPDDGKPHRKQRPGPIQLRKNVEMIAEVAIASKGICQVFVNGYAIYDSGERRTVLWLKDCTRYTCYFNKLTEKEKQYQVEKNSLSAEEIGRLLWFEPLMIKGEDRITGNIRFPVSDNTRSDADEDNEDEEREPQWYGGVHIDGPEEAYLKKEEREEALEAMTEEQREAFLLLDAGYNQREIGEVLGISRSAARDRVYGARDKYQEIRAM